MTKKLLYIVFLLLGLIQLKAQESFQPRFDLGIKAGQAYSSVLLVPQVLPQGQLSQSQFGLVGKYFSQNNLGVQLELSYTQVGWTESLDSVDTYTHRLAYVELPFLSHFNVGKKAFKWLINVGPYVGLLVDEAIEDGINNSANRQLYHDQLVDRRFAYGIQAGSGFALVTGIGTFQIEGRYSVSLSDVYSSGGGLFSSSKNQYFSGSIAYLFAIKKRVHDSK